MRHRLAGTRGLSLVEVTIMLLVLMTLTGVLAPSIMDFVNDARWVKAKEDCEAIGVSVVRLTGDVGPCLKFNGAGRCTKAYRVDLLYSDGPDVTPADVGGEAVADFNGGGNTAGALNWHADSARGDSMTRQFVDNKQRTCLPRTCGPRCVEGKNLSCTLGRMCHRQFVDGSHLQPSRILILRDRL